MAGSWRDRTPDQEISRLNQEERKVLLGLTALGLRACFEDALFGPRIIAANTLLNVFKKLS